SPGQIQARTRRVLQVMHVVDHTSEMCKKLALRVFILLTSTFIGTTWIYQQVYTGDFLPQILTHRIAHIHFSSREEASVFILLDMFGK
ncbi:43981_t:CDS:2, partial [Gigaspora margarita]